MKKFIIIFVALLYLSACDDSQNPLDPDENPNGSVVPFIWGHVGVRLGVPDKPEVNIRIKNESFDTTLIAVHNHPKGAYFWQIDNLKSGSYDFTFSADGRMTIHYPNIQYNSAVDTVNFQAISPEKVSTDLYANPEQINFELLSHNVKIYLDSVYGSYSHYYVEPVSIDTVLHINKSFTKLFTQLAYETDFESYPLVVARNQRAYFHWQLLNSSMIDSSLLPQNVSFANIVRLKIDESNQIYNFYSMTNGETGQVKLLPPTNDLVDYTIQLTGPKFLNHGVNNLYRVEGQTHPFIEGDVYMHIVPLLYFSFDEKLFDFIDWPDNFVRIGCCSGFFKQEAKTYQLDKEIIRRDIDLGEVVEITR